MLTPATPFPGFVSKLGFVAFILLLGSLSAATYHVSPLGNNSANGLTPGTAWRTLAHVNSRSFAPGDQVLLHGGQTFTDTGLRFLANNAGSAADPIVIGSYGEGRATIKPASDVHPIELYNTAGFVIENLVLEGIGRDLSTKTGVSAYTDLPGGVRLVGLTIRGCEMRELRFGVTIGAWGSDGGFPASTTCSSNKTWSTPSATMAS